MQKNYELKIDSVLRFTTGLVYIASCLPAAMTICAWWLRQNPLAFQHCESCSTAANSIPLTALPFFLLVPAATLFFRRFAPTGYILNDTGLVIERKFKPIVIPLTAIAEVRPFTDDELQWTLKLFGSGGFYGYFGLFWNMQLGKFNMYATRKKNLVAVRTANALYALSPEDTADFITTLKALTGR